MSLKINFREKTTFLSKLLHVGDCLMVCLFLYILVVACQVPRYQSYTYLLLASFVLCFITFYSFQLYRSWRGVNLYKEFIVILKAWGTTVGILLFLAFILRISFQYSRKVIIIWFVLTPFVVFSLHLLIRKIFSIIRSKGMDLKDAVIIGAGDLGIRVAKHIETIPFAGIRVIGFFDDRIQDKDTLVYDKPILGTINQLADYLKVSKLDYVYIALPMRAEAKIMSIIDECRILGAELYLVPDLYIFRLFNAEIQSLGDLLLLNFNPRERWKRWFDVVFSIFALLVTLPITLLVAALIKLEDGGPIFYRQRRVTSSGKGFICLKFRTMCVDAEKLLTEILFNNPHAREEWDRTFKLRHDPRITRVGRVLRKYSLDELPQFVNVLKGEMSVVGARPIVLTELHHYYKKHAGLYCSMKPGITGPWQVGKRSDTEDYEDRVKLDTWYALNYSLWLDSKIILKTIWCVINGKGAY